MNTTTDNSSFQPIGELNKGYIALFGEKSNYGIQDIYKVEILPFTDPLAPENPLATQDFSLTIENAETGEIIELEYNRKTDDFKIKNPSIKETHWKIKKD